MKICRNCGKEVAEEFKYCNSCGAEIGNGTKETENNTVNVKDKKKFIVPVVIIVLVIVVVGMIAFKNKPYEKVAENYINALLLPDYITYHETTIFDEEEMDKALSGYYNEKNVSVEDIYKCASVEYFGWTDEFENYKDFYNNLSEVDKADRKDVEYEITEISYTEMTDEEIEDIGYQYGLFQQYYYENYNLDSSDLIDFDKISKGYNAVAVVSVDGTVTTYNVSLVKYDGKWYTADCLSLERIVGQDIFKISILKEKIPDEVVKDKFLSMQHTAGIFSITCREVLSKCAPNCEIEIIEYEDGKNEYLSSEKIKTLEEEYSTELDNAYFAVVSGEILHNPEIPYYYSDYQIITWQLLLFDDDGNFVEILSGKVSDDFETCAILLCTQ
ncbi:MAG: zinc ribbon domain-containing protein [Clostridia bacterium]|nr:zinc ribbon domain-containing protein [Clostridia bacterium]